MLNPDDVVKLIVFDTWTLNQDRYPPEGEKRRSNPDNVYLSERDGVANRYRLIAMDHTHCFTNGRDLTARIASIGRTKESRLYGLFPAFRRFITKGRISQAVNELEGMSPTSIGGIIESIPPEWRVPKTARDALKRLLCERVEFLCENLTNVMSPLCSLHAGDLFDEGGNADGRE